MLNQQPHQHQTKMRRYYIVSGILLILPIINFAVAAPVPVQEKLQTDVDVVHPEDAITMLGKRVDDGELNELVIELFGHLPKPEESSAASQSSSSRLLQPADGWTDVKRPLPSIPEDSPLELYPSNPSTPPSTEPSSPLTPSSTEPSSPSTPSSMEPSSPSTPSSMEAFSEDGWWDEDEHGLMYHSPTSSGYGSDHELTGADAPQPNTNPSPSKDSDSDRNYMVNFEEPPPPKRLKLESSNEFDQAQEYRVAHVHQPNPGLSNAGPSNAGPSNPRLPTEPVMTLPSPNLGLPKELDDEVAQGLPPGPELTDPKLHLDHQSLSTDSQSVDPQAATGNYVGKAKESRRDTARDVRNADKRKLQLAEKMLHPGE